MKTAVTLMLASAIALSCCAAARAASDDEIRAKNAAQCVDEFLKSLPQGYETKSFKITESGVLRQPAWLEDAITSEMMAKKLALMENNADYLLDYKLIEDKKNSVKISFKLVDGKTDKVVSYSSIKAGEKEEKIDYEHRVKKNTYVKTEGVQWGLIILVGMVLIGVMLQPKI